MARRFKHPKAKEGELLARYGKVDGDLDVFYCWQGEHSMKADSRLLSMAFERTDVLDGNSLRKELESRGYDITTLKFSIMKK